MKKLLPLYFLFLFTGSVFAQEYQDWKWLHEQPQGNTLRWVKMWDYENWYAVGYSGTFMKTSDAGATWWFHHKAGLPRTDGSTSYLYDAHFFDQNNGVVVGTAGIMRTTDGGLTFDTVSGIPSAATCYQVFFLNDSVGYVAGTTSVRVARTSDAGLTWTLNTLITSATYYDVWTPNDTLIVASTTTGNIRRSTDAGLTWATVLTGASATLYKLEFSDALKGWTVGTTGSPRYTTDGGATWTTPANAGLPASTYYDIDILQAPPQVEGFENTIFPPPEWSSINVLGTNAWTRSTAYAYEGVASAFINYEPTGGEDWLISPNFLVGSSDTVVFYLRKQYSGAYPPDSLILMVSTTDTLMSSFSPLLAIDVANLPASTWVRFSASLSAYAGQNIYGAFVHKDTDGNGVYLDGLEVVNGNAVDDLWLTGDSFNMYTSADNGATWQAVSHLSTTQPWTSTYYATDFYNGKFVAVGAFGLVNSKDSYSDPMVHTYFQKAGTIYDIYADMGRIITVGAPSITGSTFDQIFISTDNGKNWNSANVSKQQPNIQYPAFVPPMEENEILESKEDNMVPNSTATFRSIEMVTPTTGYVVGSNSAVYKTTNGGLNWDSIATSITPGMTLYKVDFVSPTVGWIFNNTTDAAGTIWKTTDGAATWTAQTLTGQTGSNTRIYGAHMLDENYGWCVSYKPRPYKTTDGGATWVEQTLSDAYGGFLYDIQMIDTLVGYCCGGSGRVYKTTDGGAMWNVQTTPIGTSNTNYAVSFFDENIGVVVGSLGVVLVTSDGGTNWGIENNTGAATNYAAYIDYPVNDFDTASVYTGGGSSFIFKKAVFAVPVELTSFAAVISGSDVTLNWSTATETNNFGFEVERAANGVEWQNIGFVNGRGTVTEKSGYSFTDKNLKNGTYSYRLKQVDFDGTYKYYILSENVEISVPLEFELSQNYPNPFNPVTTIRFSLPYTTDVSLKVYDVLGTEIAVLLNSKRDAGRYEVQFDGSKYSSGVYFYELKTKEFTSVKKLILMK